jgi:hypothetical protein
MKISKVEVEVPAGKYILGDPCYAVPDSDWDGLLQSCNYFNSPIGYIKDGLQEFPVLAFGTRWGDGCYAGTDGNLYPVDAGLIGLVPAEVVDMEALRSDLHTVVTFTTTVKCSTDGNGKLRFGCITIDTDPAQDEEEDDEQF